MASAILHHTSDPECLLCDQKVSGCHPYMQTWWKWIKSKHPDIHVAWGWRGKGDQDIAVATGHSCDQFPHSPHNKVDADGKPCSDAIDIFQINDQGKDIWDPLFCSNIYTESSINGYALTWGGNYKRLKDFCHMERRVSNGSRI